jgi:hypothetical protein
VSGHRKLPLTAKSSILLSNNIYVYICTRVTIPEIEPSTCLENYKTMLDLSKVAIIIYYLYQRMHIYLLIYYIILQALLHVSVLLDHRQGVVILLFLKL